MPYFFTIHSGERALKCVFKRLQWNTDVLSSPFQSIRRDIEEHSGRDGVFRKEVCLLETSEIFSTIPSGYRAQILNAFV